MLDPKIAGVVSKDLPRNSVVVFDEAHNIDSVCIKVIFFLRIKKNKSEFQSLSVKITKRTIEYGNAGLEKLTAKVEEVERERKAVLEDEYDRLVRGLREARVEEDAGLGGPAVLPEDVLQIAIPG